MRERATETETDWSSRSRNILTNDRERVSGVASGVEIDVPMHPSHLLVRSRPQTYHTVVVITDVSCVNQ